MTCFNVNFKNKFTKVEVVISIISCFNNAKFSSYNFYQQYRKFNKILYLATLTVIHYNMDKSCVIVYNSVIKKDKINFMVYLYSFLFLFFFYFIFIFVVIPNFQTSLTFTVAKSMQQNIYFHSIYDIHSYIAVYRQIQKIYLLCRNFLLFDEVFKQRYG